MAFDMSMLGGLLANPQILAMLQGGAPLGGAPAGIPAPGAGGAPGLGGLLGSLIGGQGAPAGNVPAAPQAPTLPQLPAQAANAAPQAGGLANFAQGLQNRQPQPQLSAPVLPGILPAAQLPGVASPLGALIAGGGAGLSGLPRR